MRGGTGRTSWGRGDAGAGGSPPDDASADALPSTLSERGRRGSDGRGASGARALMLSPRIKASAFASALPCAVTGAIADGGAGRVPLGGPGACDPEAVRSTVRITTVSATRSRAAGGSICVGDMDTLFGGREADS